MKMVFNELSHYQNKNKYINTYYFTTALIPVFNLKFFLW